MKLPNHGSWFWCGLILASFCLACAPPSQGEVMANSIPQPGQSSPAITEPAESGASVPELIEQGRRLLAKGQPSKALPLLRQALRREPQNSQALLLTAVAMVKSPRPDYGQAIGLLEQAVRSAPKQARIRVYLGYTYHTNRQMQQAEQAFLAALKTAGDPRDLLAAHMGLSSLYRELGRQDKAERHWQEALKIHPGLAHQIKLAEIWQMSPPPVYRDREREGTHPSLEKRIERARQQIRELERNGK